MECTYSCFQETKSHHLYLP